MQFFLRVLYNDKDWYKKEYWWKAAGAKEESKSQGSGEGLEAILAVGPLRRS
jgi:hypothetical protein